MSESTSQPENLVQTSAINFSLTSSAVHVELPHGLTKSISIPDFIKSLEIAEGSVSSNPEGVVLPANVSYFAQNTSTICLNLYYPGGVKNIKFHDGRSNEADNLPRTVPNIVIAGRFSKRRNGEWYLQDSKYFCTDLTLQMLPREWIERVDHSKRIFLLPFTNTYESGNMCFGRNTMPTMFTSNSLRAFDWYYQYLFESAFNTDLGLYAVAGQMSVSDWFALLARRAADGQHFPYENLRGYTPQ